MIDIPIKYVSDGTFSVDGNFLSGVSGVLSQRPAFAVKVKEPSFSPVTLYGRYLRIETSPQIQGALLISKAPYDFDPTSGDSFYYLRVFENDQYISEFVSGTFSYAPFSFLTDPFPITSSTPLSYPGPSTDISTVILLNCDTDDSLNNYYVSDIYDSVSSDYCALITAAPITVGQRFSAKRLTTVPALNYGNHPLIKSLPINASTVPVNIIAETVYATSRMQPPSTPPSFYRYKYFASQPYTITYYFGV